MDERTQTNEQTGILIKRQTNKIDGWIDEWLNGQTDRHTDKKTDRQIK